MEETSGKRSAIGWQADARTGPNVRTPVEGLPDVVVYSVHGINHEATGELLNLLKG
jgi:hypothetical protein